MITLSLTPRLLKTRSFCSNRIQFYCNHQTQILIQVITIGLASLPSWLLHFWNFFRISQTFFEPKFNYFLNLICQYKYRRFGEFNQLYWKPKHQLFEVKNSLLNTIIGNPDYVHHLGNEFYYFFKSRKAFIECFHDSDLLFAFNFCCIFQWHPSWWWNFGTRKIWHCNKGLPRTAWIRGDWRQIAKRWFQQLSELPRTRV